MTITAVLLFVRLRALLFAVCRDHPVAFCDSCRQAYKPEELRTEICRGPYLCRQCGTDRRASLRDDGRRCPTLTPQKPAVRMTSLPGTRSVQRRQSISG